MLQRFDHPCLGACLDGGHAQIAGDVVEMARALAPYLIETRLSDNHGRMDERRAPGQGTLPWRAFFRALRESGYREALGIEIALRPGEDAVAIRDKVRRWWEAPE